MAYLDPITVARFWSKVDVRVSADECWVWKGSKGQEGYGKFKVNGMSRTASRIAWELHNEKTLGNLYALHKCDNPSCCNPYHIFPGTHDDNMQDMKSKGRARGHCNVGHLNGNAKLSPADVAEIRRRIKRGEKNTKIARYYPVTHSTISNIRRGVSW